METRTVYQIKEWNGNYENNRSREMNSTLRWVSIPNRHDGLGFRRLMKMKAKGAQIFAAFIVIVQCCSKHLWKRDGFLTENGSADARPWTASDLEDMTGMSARLFSQALSALSDDRIDWIEPVTVTIDVVDNQRLVKITRRSGDEIVPPECLSDGKAVTKECARNGTEPAPQRQHRASRARAEWNGRNGMEYNPAGAPARPRGAGQQSQNPQNSGSASASQYGQPPVAALPDSLPAALPAEGQALWPAPTPTTITAADLPRSAAAELPKTTEDAACILFLNSHAGTQYAKEAGDRFVSFCRYMAHAWFENVDSRRGGWGAIRSWTGAAAGWWRNNVETCFRAWRAEEAMAGKTAEDSTSPPPADTLERVCNVCWHDMRKCGEPPDGCECIFDPDGAEGAVEWARKRTIVSVRHPGESWAQLVARLKAVQP